MTEENNQTIIPQESQTVIAEITETTAEITAEAAPDTPAKGCGCGANITNKELNPRHQALLQKFREGKYNKDQSSNDQNINSFTSETTPRPRKIFL
jgi:DNA-binding NarL/FixJ family response regulator